MTTKTTHVGGELHDGTLTLTHADLLAATSAAPAIVVPAPGAGKILMPIFYRLESNIATAYTIDGTWRLFLGTISDALVISGALTGSGNALTESAISAYILATEIYASPKSLGINKPIVFGPNAASGPLTDGASGNWVEISVAYYVYAASA